MGTSIRRSGESRRCAVSAAVLTAFVAAAFVGCVVHNSRAAAAPVAGVSTPSKASAKLLGSDLSNTNRKVCVLVQPEGNDPSAAAFAEYCANILEEGLRKAGFEVFQKDVMEKRLAEEGRRMNLISDDPATLIAVGQKYSVDVYIRGSLKSETQSAAGSAYQGIAVLSLRAVDMRNGKALGSFASSALGTELRPGPVRGTSLAAKQEAISRASYEAVSWLGVPVAYVSDMLRLSYEETLAVPVSKPSAIAFTSGSDGVAVAEGKSVRIIDPASGNELHKLACKGKAVTLATRHTTGDIGIGLDNGTVVIWTPSSGETRTLGGCAGAVQALSFSYDGALLAAGDEKGNVCAWNAKDGGVLYSIAAHPKRDGKTPIGVRAVGFVSGSDYLVSLGQDKMIKKWDAGSGGLVLTVSEAESIMDPKSPWSRVEIFTGAFNPQATVTAISVVNKDIDLQRNRMEVQSFIVARGIDGRGDRVVITLPERDTKKGGKPVIAMAFFPNCPRFVAVGGEDGLAAIYDLSSSQSVWREYYDSEVNALAFSDSGDWLAIATPGKLHLRRQR